MASKDELRKSILSQMYILKAHMETIVYMIEELEKEEEQCNHPKKFRRNYTTMGGKEHWICEICGFEYKEGGN